MSIEVQKQKTFYKTINTTFVGNSSLSLRAKGIMVYLLAKPPGWKAQIFDIAKKSKDKESSVRSAIKELVKAGYAKRVHNPMVKGKFQGSHYIVSDFPEFLNDD